MKLQLSTQYKKSLKRILQSGVKVNQRKEVLRFVIDSLLAKKALPLKYRDHALTGEWIGFMDCHLEPDLILIYRINDDILEFLRIGSHSELFG